MSFELSDVILGCGLERGGRRAVLEALAHFADQETGMVRVSQVRLAQRAGLSERQVRRVLEGAGPSDGARTDGLLSDPQLHGLVRRVRSAGGRGHAAVYRLDVGRLEPLRAAMTLAARRIYAGVAKALLDGGLTGGKASPRNIQRAFEAIAGALKAEEEFTALRAVQALRDEFEAAMSRFDEISVIGRPLGGPTEAVEGEAKPGHNVRLSDAGNPDTVSRNPDMVSAAHNKDSSPSGVTPFAREAACGRILAGAAVNRAAFLFATEGLLAHATVNRRERLQLVEDLQGRLARVTRDGVLAIRVRTEAEAAAMAGRWLEPLLGWAADLGLAGVVFDGGDPQPAPISAAVEG